MMREKTCCFTGHRVIPADQKGYLESALRQTIDNLIGRGFRFFGAGGALGFDTMAAQAVLSWKIVYPHIRLILVLPCPEQGKYWTPAQKFLAGTIRERADKVVYTSAAYHSGCMYQRDRHLVDCSSVCVAYCRRNTGGTAYTVRYVRQQGLELISL